MKNTLVSIFIVAVVPFRFYNQPGPEINLRLVTKNVFIITTDGFRWQEVFTGADSLLINDEQYTLDANTLNAMYWSSTAEERRKNYFLFSGM